MSPAFAVSWEPSQLHRRSSLRANQYGRPRKRKRHEEGSGESDDEDAPDPPNTTKGQSSRSGFTALTTEIAEQYRIAGYPPDDDLPPPPFPHASATQSSTKRRESNVQKELAAFKPPLYAANGSPGGDLPGRSIDSKPAMSAPRHLAVLTTLLHRCLLEGDYDRAGRAWDLIRKLERQSRALDVRAHGRWGLGAELLLYRDAQTRPTTRNRRERSTTSGHSDDVPVAPHLQPQFTAHGFRAAREYYEQLILQYPGSRAHPHAISATAFYPAMFSLWIFGVCETSRQSRDALKDDTDTDTESDDESGHRHQEQLANIMRTELKQAADIAARLDELLFSPPYDKHPDLLQLRGMIALWMGDLMKHTPAASEDNPDADTEGACPGLDRRSRQKNAEKDEEIKRAARFFFAREKMGITHLANQEVADNDLASGAANTFIKDAAASMNTGESMDEDTSPPLDTDVADANSANGSELGVVYTADMSGYGEYE
ncbi:hypothetical protein H2199_008129 [Coniosporium tulheliwenetii]|uniref:Uncharacterized protein n=1 Tax=Coniosporium tulheliwenetii TaxID=3383036 RepID=A0ACC2YKH6_9PEZI|nr:hypothetical protein H2199_008129 [Cladosporium sp. JES 115]